MKFSKIFLRTGCFLMSLVMSCVLCAGGFTSSAVKYRDNMLLRVGLKYSSSAVASATLTSEQGFLVVSANEETGEYTPLFETTETSVTVKNVGGNAVVYSKNGVQLYAGTDTLYLRAANDLMQYDSKTYKDFMKFFCKDGLMRVINVVSLENYVKGVLPREIYPSWPEEALKTAAIVARSFAISSFSGKHDSYGFDVCTTTCCQVFGGNGSNEYASTNAAIDATKNIVVAYGDEVALTVYNSSSGDATESAAGAWGGSEDRYPYLISVKTPFETPEQYPNGVWSKEVSQKELLEYINSKSSYKGKLSGSIVSIVCEHADSGYVRKLTVTDIKGNKIEVNTSGNTRSFMGKYVNSGKFTITGNYFESDSTVSVLTANGVEKRQAVPYGAYVLRAENEKPQALYANYIPLSFTISGVGWGHGVGLSQFGNMTLAKNGKTYEEILAIYFPGTYLTTLGGLAILDGLEEIPEDFENYEDFSQDTPIQTPTTDLLPEDNQEDGQQNQSDTADITSQENGGEPSPE